MSATSSGPRALLVGGDSTWMLAVAATLRARGCNVSCASRVSEALAHPRPDLLISETSLDDGTGVGLLEALGERGARPHTMLLTERPTLHECRVALRAGARDYIGKPFRIEEVLRALRDWELTLEHGELSPKEFSVCGRATIEAGRSAINELLAFLVLQGIAPSTRARVASAVGELLENVAEHAYALAGDSEEERSFELIAQSEGDVLEVDVCDRGVGIGILGPVLAPLLAAQNHGLQRAASLSESFRIEPREGGGTRASMSFRTASVVFDEDIVVDLSELDYLPPEMARHVLDALEFDEDPPLYNLSPALAVVVGRLLARPTEGASSQPAAWS